MARPGGCYVEPRWSTRQRHAGTLGVAQTAVVQHGMWRVMPVDDDAVDEEDDNVVVDDDGDEDACRHMLQMHWWDATDDPPPRR